MKNEIINDLRDFYELDIQQIEKMEGGWLNEKYLLSCIQGKYVLKIFSLERYNQEQLEDIKKAATIQTQLQCLGLCPQILKDAYRNHYQVMTYEKGQIKDAKSITKDELYQLGKSIATLHEHMKSIPSNERMNGFNFLNSVWHYHHQQKSILDEDLYKQQTKILQSLSASFFDELPQGICHEDLSNDNILFDGNKVIFLDFDRAKHHYYHHDIGRIILSFCFEDDHLNEEKVNAFLEGANLTQNDVKIALKVTWCVESPWWINEKYLNLNLEKTQQFTKQLLWLTNHFFDF